MIEQVKIITITDKELRNLVADAVQEGIQKGTAAGATEPTITAKQLAERLNCSVQHVYNMVDRDELPTLRAGQSIVFLYSEVIEAMRAKGKSEMLEQAITSRR